MSEQPETVRRALAVAEAHEFLGQLRSERAEMRRDLTALENRIIAAGKDAKEKREALIEWVSG